MKAEEIREFINGCPKDENGIVPKDWWLAEIAAQLAELNETLKGVTGQVGTTAMGIFVSDLGRRE